MPELAPLTDQQPAPAPFVWGAGGAQMTPERIAAERKVAQAMQATGMDFSPIRSPFQGAARVAQAIMGAYDERRTNQSEDEMYKNANALLLANPALGGSAPAAASPSAAAPVAVPPQVSAVLGAGGQPATPDAQGVYGADAVLMPQGSPPGTDYGKAIASIESAGQPSPYAAVGPATKTGDRAYGKYQVMGANIPAWTKEHLGQEMTPQQFVASPQAQDAVFNGQFGKYVQQTGNPQDAASMWFTGVPAAQGANRRAMTPEGVPYGPNGQSYVQRFTKALGPTVAQTDPAALPPNATPTQGTVPPGVPTPPVPGAPPGVAKVAAAMTPQAATPAVTRQMAPEVANYVKSLIANPMTRAQGIQILGQYSTPRDQWVQETGADGTQYQRNTLTGEKKVVDAAPQSVQEYNYYKSNLAPGTPPMDYATWATSKARAGATQVAQNVDLNATQTYDKLLAEGLGKSHAALSNGVEDAQARARDLAAMQGAIDTIQKNGGTTGGLGQQQILDLKKTLNAGAAAVGISTPFNENDISDKEFLTKFNRQIAGAQAKGAVGGRVTNFEMANYLKANPGLDMSVTGNQRLIGIQSQIEQRNIAVGNAIREATAAAISKGQKIDPVTVQKIVRDYDEQHHVADPVSGQDLTQSYTLPEFQTGGSNPTMAVGHETNIGGIKIKRVQ